MSTATANFRSDNEAPVAAPILQALADCNSGSAHAYGDDQWSQRLDAAFSACFDTDVKVLPVATGTAANSIALAAMSPPWGSILCHQQAHIHNDECGAPEFYSHGAKLAPLPGELGKLTAATVQDYLAQRGAHGVHESLPSALSLTQSCETGTVYQPDEIKALAAVAREHQLGVHMDGARFANAVVSLGCHPADITWRAGVDMLSFGASKNGAMAAEALLLFGNHALWDDVERRRKRAGHLLSKMRYLAVQLLAYLEDDLWLKLATQANRQASRFAVAVEQHPEAALAYPVQANEVFLRLAEDKLIAMQEQGLDFHLWPGSRDLARLVFAHSTTDAETDRLIDALNRV
ncbi:MAG: low specificity L-threonine aldolase [Wenzhouxiangellaceae bacterium]